MDPTVYYYSYSTLAQSLAGAFGFLAAVVLYRLQSLNGQLQVIASQLIGDPRTFNLEPFRTLFAYHRWVQFVRQVHLDQESRAPVFKDLNFMDLGAMDHASKQILMIRRWFLISMIMTVAGIASSLVSLFLMGWMQSVAVLAVLLLLGLLSLAAYTRLMLLVLE
jgi:hypothetical protein